MGRASRKKNPFQPGAGAFPPVFAGRHAELALAAELLDSLEAGRRPSRGLLFFGPRGNGKTSLLDRIAADARERELRAEDLLVSAFETPAALIRRLREKTGLTGARIRDVRLGGVGIAVEPGSAGEDAAKLLAAWIGAGRRPLVILLDEAHAVRPEAGRLFFDAVQAATRGALPFLLLAAGTPDAPRRIRRAGSYTERALRRLRVGRLERDETIRALVEPTENAGLPLRAEAATLLAEESRDYPYFIQLLGSAAWEAAADDDAGEITVDSARNGIAAARPEIAAFHSERFDEARGRGVHRALAPLAALAAGRGGWLDDDSLDEFLAREADPGGEAELLDTLEDLGVLWETDAAVWEFGIPSFADHILRRASRSPAGA